MNAETIASLTTAAGTLMLAVATFQAVRSANRCSRLAEEALLANMRPVITHSRLDDARQKVGFGDGHWIPVDGADFRMHVRDLLVAPGDPGFWQAALRDPADDVFARFDAAVKARERVSVDVLYTDMHGHQRAITRFTITPAGERWLSTTNRHFSLDGPNPRG